MQKKIHSALETCISTVIGFYVALITQLIVFPFFGISITLSANLTITVIFTVVSLVRGYAVRRFFNWLHAEGLL